MAKFKFPVLYRKFVCFNIKPIDRISGVMASD